MIFKTLFNLILIIMAVYNTNQNRQFYVIKSFEKDSTKFTGKDANPAAQSITVKTVGEGNCKELYFLYKGADTVLKSDRIPLKNLDYIKATKAEDLRTPLKSVKVSLKSEVNGGKPVLGQDYLLRINFTEFYGTSVYDTYVKDAAVHVTSNLIGTDNQKPFYDAMVDALNAAFARELGATKGSNPYLTFTSAADGITITEKVQPWHLGIEKQERVKFDVFPTTVYDGVDDVTWGKADVVTPKKGEDGTWTPALVVSGAGQNAIGNGHEVADMEHFFMGERGDQYRYKGYPNYIPTQYLVDATKEYNTLDIHFAFTDTGVNSYRSEKDITLVWAKDDNANVNGTDGLIKAINTATGLTVATI